MEKHNKISGRQKQLLKTGIRYDNFKTLHSSTIIDNIRHSQDNNGDTELMPVDWQVDLGNYCNSACVMCLPEWSSRLSTELHELGIIAKPEKFIWSEDRDCLDNFLSTLDSTPNIRYIHFLGGETTLMPAFKTILEHIKTTCRNTIIGFTTNLTTFDDDLVKTLKNFKEVHVGLSIESLTELNDYIRWPSKIDVVKNNLKKWIKVSKQAKWIVSIRPTPSLLSISTIAGLFELAYEHMIGIESCHFLYRPKCLTIQSLPMEYREPVLAQLRQFIQRHSAAHSLIVNVRNPSLVRDSVVQDAQSLCNFLEEEPYDTAHHGSLVEYLKKLEKRRKNNVLEYLPEYEKFFRSIGY